ncbi:MAG TPA: hypothetical protein VKZ93_00220 [Arenibacter sp.]|nr:hypothetical protein [Arenibacter sp.]
MIQRENTFLLGYVIFDKISGRAEVDVGREADRILGEKIASGELILPKGVWWRESAIKKEKGLINKNQLKNEEE